MRSGFLGCVSLPVEHGPHGQEPPRSDPMGGAGGARASPWGPGLGMTAEARGRRLLPGGRTAVEEEVAGEQLGATGRKEAGKLGSSPRARPRPVPRSRVRRGDVPAAVRRQGRRCRASVARHALRALRAVRVGRGGKRELRRHGAR